MQTRLLILLVDRSYFNQALVLLIGLLVEIPHGRVVAYFRAVNCIPNGLVLLRTSERSKVSELIQPYKTRHDKTLLIIGII